jgi:hypothetical protein
MANETVRETEKRHSLQRDRDSETVSDDIESHALLLDGFHGDGHTILRRSSRLQRGTKYFMVAVFSVTYVLLAANFLASSSWFGSVTNSCQLGNESRCSATYLTMTEDKSN